MVRVSQRQTALSMTPNEFLRLLRFYLACIDAEDRRSLTKRISTLHHSAVSPWDDEEPLFHPAATEALLDVNARSDLELLLGAVAPVAGAERFLYGYPIFLDERGFLSPLFFTDVEVVHIESCRFVVRASGEPRLNHHVFARYHTQPEELRAIRAELEGPFGSFAARLRAAFEMLGVPMAAFIQDRLERLPNADLPWNRWVNRPVLFKSEWRAHTHHLRRELEALAEYPRLFTALAATAAGVVAGIGAPSAHDRPRSNSACIGGPRRGSRAGEAVRSPRQPPQLLQVLPLNNGQEHAARAALRAPLTVVTGPPGTGKSQVVVDLLASCALARCPVLFSSKNNKAVDAVRTRLRETLGHDRDWTLRLGSRQVMAESQQEMSARLAAVQRGAAPALPPPTLLDEAGEELSQTDRRIQELERAQARFDGLERARLVAQRCIDRLARLVQWRATEVARKRVPAVLGAEPSAEDLTELDKLKQRRAELAASQLGGLWTGRVASRAPWVRNTLEHYFDLSSRVRRNKGSAFFTVLEQFKNVVRVMGSDLPVWIVTNLSVRNALPLEPALFDLVILDEASQCDIPSALPLLFRARRVLVIGDPRQLRHISTLSSSEEERLAHQCGVASLLPTWSYNERSLYSLAEKTVVERGGEPLFLAEHYRSHPDIVEFSNQAFYQRRLIVRTRLETLRERLACDELGLYWHNVGGTVRPSSRSAVNDREVRAVLDLLDEWSKSGFLLRDGVDFGIVTPFRLQMERLREAVRTRPWWEQVKGRLTLGTAHQFQGDERDVMIFSPVVTEGMSPRLVRWVADADQLLNVAITRARAALHVVGDLAACVAAGGFLGGFAATVTNRGRVLTSPPLPRGEQTLQRCSRPRFSGTCL